MTKPVVLSQHMQKNVPDPRMQTIKTGKWIKVSFWVLKGNVDKEKKRKEDFC